MLILVLEYWMRILGAIAGLVTLSAAIVRMLSSLMQPPGREEPGARVALRIPVLLIATVLFFIAGALLWLPLAIHPSVFLRAVLLLIGTPLLFGGLGLYLWGLRTLRRMFAPSSGFGVRLQISHHLVTSGPYAYIRHPMYLAVISASIGTLLLFRTWAALCLAVLMFGLVVRARREERILAEEFGPDWTAYTARVPAWFPRLRSRDSSMRYNRSD